MPTPSETLYPSQSVYPEAAPTWRLVARAGGDDATFYEAERGLPITWPGALTGITGAFFWVLKTRPSSSLAELYINGVSQGSKALTADFRNPSKLAVGMTFNGCQQHVAVVEGDVSSGDIRALHKAARLGV